MVKNRNAPFFSYLYENIYILSTGRARTGGTRAARTWAWTHRGWSLSGAESTAIENPLDIFALTLYTGYLAFFHFIDRCSNLKAFMTILTFKIIVWHFNFPFYSYYSCQLYFLYLFILQTILYVKKKSIKPLQNLLKKPAKGPLLGRFSYEL